MIKLFWVVIRY